ncbi:transglycosylase domain-containing protein [Xylanimonas sp. McL0601]|uniref:transglycosylase domain-containing protein n=1 Tax=Xylanimonas sp. McL0601 TaxID=3414739 RepID=UPI003CF9376D
MTGSARRPSANPRRRRFLNYPRRGKGLIQRWLPSWRIVVGTVLGVAALGSGTFVAAYATTTVPGDLDTIDQQTTTIYYSDGKTPIGTLANERRVLVKVADLPDYVGGAVVASEDSSFWTNSGVDLRGIARAAVNNLKGGAQQGGSTLTMQYIERTKTDSNTSMVGKVREAIMAVKVTRSTEKDQILEGYLNTIYWGRGVYGVEAASQAYFGKSAKDLTYSEAALLSGIIPSPNNWDPSVSPKTAERRWQRSIDRMYAAGEITADEHAKATFPKFKPKPKASNSLGGQAGFLVEAVTEELSKTDQFKDHPERIKTDGLNIVTTIDKKDQDAAAAAAAEAAQGDHPASPNLQVGVVSMDPTNGEVRALYGGADYLKNQYNFATKGYAQAGSTFKPFTLVAALEAGHKLSDRFEGPSTKIFPKANDGVDWKVKNFGFEPFGNIDLVDATANSVNTVYAALNIEVGPDKTADVAHRMGIPDVKAGRPGFVDPVPSDVLGVASVRPIDLATAYSTIAGGGYRVTPHLVREVKRLDGALVYEGSTDRTREFDPEVIKAATYAMTQVVERGSGTTAKELGRPVAGKTGTTQDSKSAWFAAFVPQLVTVVGMHQESIDKSGKVNEETITPFGQWHNVESMTGGSYPARAWTDYMKVALDGVPVQPFPDYNPPREQPLPSAPASETPTDVQTEQAPVDPQAGWVKVPKNLVGKQVNVVTNELKALSLDVNLVAVASQQPKSTVLSVDRAGTKVPPGSTLLVQVSTGVSGNGNGNGNGSTSQPTDQPTAQPTDQPTAQPTDQPTAQPTDQPTPDPAASPTPGKGSG